MKQIEFTEDLPSLAGFPPMLGKTSLQIVRDAYISLGVGPAAKNIESNHENRVGWWRRRELNPWPPQCHCGALPTELRPQPFLRDVAERCYRPPPRLSNVPCASALPFSTTALYPQIGFVSQTNRIQIYTPIAGTYSFSACYSRIIDNSNPVRFAETHVFTACRPVAEQASSLPLCISVHNSRANLIAISQHT